MYAAFFTFLIFGGLFAPKSLGKIYLFWVMLLLLLIMGFRSELVGSDTLSYLAYFESMSNISLQGVEDTFAKALREPLYYFTTWGLRQITSSTILYLFFWALFPCVSVYCILRDELTTPKDYMVAILCLFSLGFFAFFVAGIRQTAAIALVFLSYRYLQDIDISLNPFSYFKGKSLKFALCLLLAFWCHNSAILILGALPFLKVKVRWWYLPIVVMLFFVGQFFSIGFIAQVAAYVFGDTYSAYGTEYESSQSINGFIMQFILFLMCFLRYPQLRDRDRTNITLFNLVLVGMVLQSFSGMLAEMWRAAFYFSIFFLILVPRAIREYPQPLRSLIYPSFACLLIIYLFFLASAQLPPYTSSIF